jgi:hypothetical protein
MEYNAYAKWPGVTVYNMRDILALLSGLIPPPPMNEWTNEL